MTIPAKKQRYGMIRSDLDESAQRNSLRNFQVLNSIIFWPPVTACQQKGGPSGAALE
jgi:hypothetical protein